MLRNYQFPSLRFLYKSIFSDKQIRNKDKDRIKFRLLREKLYIFQEMTSHLIIGVSKIFFLNSSMLFVLIFVKLGHVEKPDQKLFSIPEWYIAIDTLNNKTNEIDEKIKNNFFLSLIRSIRILEGTKIKYGHR